MWFFISWNISLMANVLFFRNKTQLKDQHDKKLKNYCFSKSYVINKKKRLKDQWSNQNDFTVVVFLDIIIRKFGKLLLGQDSTKKNHNFFEFFISQISCYLIVIHRYSWFLRYLKFVGFCLIHHFDLLYDLGPLKLGGKKEIRLNRLNKKMIRQKDYWLFLLRQS